MPAGHPVFDREDLAAGLADTLNQRETVREQRHWLREQDGERDRK